MAGAILPSGQQSDTTLHGMLPIPAFSPQEMLAARNTMKAWIKSALEEGTDYGVIPGTKKSALLKAGADNLEGAFGFTTSFDIIEKDVDHDRVNQYDAGRWVDIEDPGYDRRRALVDAHPGRYRNFKRNGSWVLQERLPETGESIGFYRYVVKARVYDRHGVFLGEATGICSSMESKYIRSPRDAEHTVHAMAAKRAKVMAMVSVLKISDAFDAEGDAAEPTKPAQEEAHGSAPVAIRGMAAVVRDWDINPVKEKELKEICISRGLKVADAITEAQRSEGPSAIESHASFLAWLDRAHPAAETAQEDQS